MKRLLPFLLLLLPVLGFAQTLNFTAATTTGDGSVVPVLTWSTTPAATSCTASGDPAWTGTKAVSGTQTLAAITSSKTYNMLCTWPGSSDTVQIFYAAPIANTDGSSLTDLKGFKIYSGTSPTTITQLAADYANPGKLSGTLGPFTPGTYYFIVKAYNQNNVESEPTNPVNIIVGATKSASRQVGITVNPQPMPPTNVTVKLCSDVPKPAGCP